jgi:hypothetical protein
LVRGSCRRSRHSARRPATAPDPPGVLGSRRPDAIGCRH